MGARRLVRKQYIGEEESPLQYLDCIVILGISPIPEQLRQQEETSSSSLLDGATVFQTADGTTRIYMMPYSTSEYMWQLSFPMSGFPCSVSIRSTGTQRRDHDQMLFLACTHPSNTLGNAGTTYFWLIPSTIEPCSSLSNYANHHRRCRE